MKPFLPRVLIQHILVLSGILAMIGLWQPVYGFSAGVSPPRFELRAGQGVVVREVLSVYNAGDVEDVYTFRTADWDLNESGGVVIRPPDLAEGSCRPWTRIERRRVKLAPGTSKRYRFEVHVPDDAPAGECRFALIIEPAADQSIDGDAAGGLSVALPISARLAVIVYVVIGEAKSRLEVRSVGMRSVQGRKLPVLEVENLGNAHGRPTGFVTARDASGATFDLNVVPYPVLPGKRSAVVLLPDPAQYPNNQPMKWRVPLQLQGQLETLDGDVVFDLAVE